MFHRFTFPLGLISAIGLVSLSACGRQPQPASDVTPQYNRATGRLEQLVTDKNGDGRPEARAFMDGTALKRIELDRNSDGAPDRWEYYGEAAAGVGSALSAGAPPAIVRAEEANGSDSRVTRREAYDGGRLTRVEEDTDLDGRTDKWETYVAGELRYVDLDLDGSGSPTQRLTYGPGGEVTSAALSADVSKP